MQLILLNGKDVNSDKELIKKKLKENDRVVFVLDNECMLYEYIDKLTEAGLEGYYCFKLSICKEIKNLDVNFLSYNTKNVHIDKMSKLVELINKKDKCKIIINNNNRSTLANIVQQLVYLDIPLSNVNVMTKNEEKDIDKTNRFLNKVSILEKAVKESISKMEELPNVDEKFGRKKNEVCESLKCILNQIKKAQDVELKIAVAASKKSGKSVIVNSMIGEELAPTSLLMATPNNCIYKKSIDNKYHLKYNDKISDYKSADDIKKEITNIFEEAQKDEKNGFSIPDMEVSYVTDKNNFSAFTIYDTPGPDAAHTNHYLAANKAIEKSDVIIFAMDYSKYLTQDEENYLKKIKTKFNNMEKFNSIIFVLNKLDLRYNDGAENSVIKILDFIKNRLIKIDSCYKDCIIIGTSALQYFNCLEAKRLPKCNFNNIENFQSELKNGIKEYRGKKEIKSLQFINNQCQCLDSYSCIECNSIQELMDYSGMPNLLDYVEYITKNKARDEIINYVTSVIDNQRTKIQNIFKSIDMLEELIKENDEKIMKIKEIFTKFSDSIKEILDDNIKEKETQLNKINILNSYKIKCNKKEKKLSFNSIAEIVNYELEQDFSEKEFRKKIVNDIEGRICSDLIKLQSKKREEERILITRNEFEEALKGTLDNFNKIASDSINVEIKERFEKQKKNLDKIKEDSLIILENRLCNLKELIRICQQDLKKECNFNFEPLMPEFSFGFEVQQDTINIEINIKKDNIKVNLFEKLMTQIGGFEQILRNIFKHKSFRVKEFEFKFNPKTFHEQFKEIELELIHAIDEIDLKSEYKSGIKKAKENIDRYLLDINRGFEEFNLVCDSSISQFTELVDDTKIYKQEKELLKKNKAYFAKIEENVSEFLTEWNEIINEKKDIRLG